MKTLNVVKKIIRFPLVVIWRILLLGLLPIWMIVGFFDTDWEDGNDVNYFKKTILEVITFGIKKL